MIPKKPTNFSGKAPPQQPVDQPDKGLAMLQQAVAQQGMMKPQTTRPMPNGRKPPSFG